MALPLLLSVDELQATIKAAHPRIRIVDLRATEAFDAGHLPGAVPMDAARLNRPAPPMAGLLPTRDSINGLLRTAGVSPGEHIIACDAGGTTAAARLIWVLHCYGFTACSLLDGGVNAWQSGGHPMDSKSGPVAPGSLELGEALADGPIMSADDLLSELDYPALLPLDVRSYAEYVGSDVRSAQGGRIPGAVHFEWSDMLLGDGTLRPADELSAQLHDLGITAEKKVVPYCQSHQRSSLAYVVLRHLGFDNVTALDGAWSNWGNRADLPRQTGPAA